MVQLAYLLPNAEPFGYNRWESRTAVVRFLSPLSIDVPIMPITTLSEMSAGQEADLFLLMIGKDELKTKTDKPYFKVGFRDGTREVSFPIWSDSPWAVECRDRWTPGVFYKIRAVYRETSFGPQLEIRKIRETVEADAADGFDPNACLSRSRFESRTMYDALLGLSLIHI